MDLQLPPEPRTSRTVVVVMGEQKSMGAGVLLAVLFGPLGLLYATPMGGLVMMGVAFFLGLVTFGLGLFLAWLGSIVWAVIAVGQHNDRLAAAARAAGQ